MPIDLLFDPTVRLVAVGAAVLGLVSGALGTFAVLRRQSLLGDAISHAALPGIALAYLVTGTKSLWPLVIGAILAGWLATVVVSQIVRSTRVPFDSALGGVMAVFFGFGLLLLTLIQSRGQSSQAGLDKFLFGQVATLLPDDIGRMTILGGTALVVLLLFWKEWKVLSFDPDYAATLGLPVRTLDAALTTLLVLAIVTGLQGVGVVLMSAMVVAPAVTARQWTNRLGAMVALAGLFGAMAGGMGVLLSVALSRPGRPIPAGPVIVLMATLGVVVSLLAVALRQRLSRGRAATPTEEPHARTG